MVRMLVALFLGVVSISAQAEMKFGAGFVAGDYTVQDPEGDTDSADETGVVGIITLPVNRNYPSWRYWFQLGHNSFEYEARTDQVGQEVTYTSLEGQIHLGFNVAREFKPWIGAGLGASLADYEGRHTIDEDGYLADSFEDRSETNTFLLLNAGLASTKLDAGFHVGLAATHKIPFDDGIEATELNLFFLF